MTGEGEGTFFFFASALNFAQELNWKRLLRRLTPALKATITGPFHREKGLDASIGSKASIRGKNG